MGEAVGVRSLKDSIHNLLSVTQQQVETNKKPSPLVSFHKDSSLQSYKPSASMSGVIQNFDRMSTISHTKSQIQIEELERCLKTLEKTWAIHSAKALENDELTATYSFWAQVQDFFSVVTGAFSAVLGISALSSGNVAAGSFLIGSASLSFTNLIMKYGNLWDSIAESLAPNDPELKSSIATYLPLAFAAVACGATVYGGYSSLVSSALPSTSSSWVKMFQTATTIGYACSLIATGRGGAKVDWSRAEMTKIEREIESLQEEHEDIVRRFQEESKSQTEITEAMAAITEVFIAGSTFANKNPV